MSNRVSPVVFLALFVLIGKVHGEGPPKSGQPSTPEPISAIARLNPYYLGISGALLANDTEALKGYVKDLENEATSHPEVWLDAMCARVYVLEKIDDLEAFTKAMIELCTYKPSDLATAKSRYKFVTRTLIELRLNQKNKWIKHTSKKLLPLLGPDPDPLYVLVLRYGLQYMKKYTERAVLLAKLVRKASTFLNGKPKKHAMRAYWNSGFEELYYLSIHNHFAAMKLDPLSSEVASHLDLFGTDGRHAPQVFYLLLNALNYYYTKLAKLGTTLFKPPDRAWLQRWMETFTTRKAGVWAKKIAAEWNKWENGKEARIELALEPRHNPKFQAQINLRAQNPTIKDFLDILTSTTGLQFSVADNIPEHLVVWTSLDLHEVPAWRFMDKVRDYVVSEGEWKREMAGQQVVGYHLTGILKPPLERISGVNSEDKKERTSMTSFGLLFLIVATGLLLTLSLTYWWIKRRGRQPTVSA